jgi:hypothetical protein
MLRKEIIAVYYENHTKTMHTLHGKNEKLLIVKAGGTYIYHWLQIANVTPLSDCRIRFQ